ncbi:MAG: hypothetical protein CSYNP_00234 [Syntrophus sp. SKADARSKE-3]|nr:hypothetical protein [Syntrophus sp. SKADARSKE-3]
MATMANNWLMSMPVPVTPQSRAQVHSISPEPLPRSSTRLPFSRRNAVQIEPHEEVNFYLIAEVSGIGPPDVMAAPRFPGIACLGCGDIDGTWGATAGIAGTRDKPADTMARPISNARSDSLLVPEGLLILPVLFLICLSSYFGFFH